MGSAAAAPDVDSYHGSDWCPTSMSGVIQNCEMDCVLCFRWPCALPNMDLKAVHRGPSLRPASTGTVFLNTAIGQYFIRGAWRSPRARVDRRYETHAVARHRYRGRGAAQTVANPPRTALATGPGLAKVGDAWPPGLWCSVERRRRAAPSFTDEANVRGRCTTMFE